MSRIHDAAAVGFARGAEAYELGRPEYPAEALEPLRLTPDLTVLDLAAGTGKLTRPLVAGGARVIAVEPVAEMRAALPASVEALDGTAESIPLDDGSVDLVTVAQAFHWFDGDAALAEIHRVLAPGGRLALIWNRRREDAEINVAISELLEPYRAGTPAHSTETWREAFERTTLFRGLEEHEFANEQTLDAEGMADRLGSISFVAALPEGDRAPILDAARALAGDGTVTIPYRTEVMIWTRSA